MKKLIYIAIAAIFAAPAMAQPVSDRGVIPVAVTLNQILRLNITNGGNIEFVFNAIGQYEVGIPNGASGMYDTDFNVASSTPWELDMGAEDATFFGTDDPLGTMPLAHVGYTIVATGGHAFGTELTDPLLAATPPGIVLAVFVPLTPVIGSALLAPRNGGDIADNAFTINWECGTGAPVGSLVPFELIDQTPTLLPDRYVTNVFLDLRSAP